MKILEKVYWKEGPMTALTVDTSIDAIFRQFVTFVRNYDNFLFHPEKCPQDLKDVYIHDYAVIDHIDYEYKTNRGTMIKKRLLYKISKNPFNDENELLVSEERIHD